MLRRYSRSLVGFLAEDGLREFHANRLFLSTGGMRYGDSRESSVVAVDSARPWSTAGLPCVDSQTVTLEITALAPWTVHVQINRDPFGVPQNRPEAVTVSREDAPGWYDLTVACLAGPSFRADSWATSRTARPAYPDEVPPGRTTPHVPQPP
jgi:hypothetical protein